MAFRSRALSSAMRLIGTPAQGAARGSKLASRSSTAAQKKESGSSLVKGILAEDSSSRSLWTPPAPQATSTTAEAAAPAAPSAAQAWFDRMKQGNQQPGSAAAAEGPSTSSSITNGGFGAPPLQTQRLDAGSMKLNFGPHTGKTLEEVPKDYLFWLRKQMNYKREPGEDFASQRLNYRRDHPEKLLEMAFFGPPKPTFSTVSFR